MSATSLKDKAVKGALWTGLEKLFRQIAQFAIGIVLARLLQPEDYGVIGMLTVFLAIAQTFTDSGMGSALIQKQDKTEKDYCTVFYFNVIVAIILYIVISLCSPLIADFYHMPILEEVTPYVALSLVINAIYYVHLTRLSVELKFKEQSIISVLSTIFSGLTGIVLAYNGLGVWALVFQTLSSACLSAILFWYYSKWCPKLIFSKKSFNQLFGFGSKLLGSGLINTIYGNMYALVIGRTFSPADVGYYNRARNYGLLPLNTINDMSIKVTYPILSTIQDDDERLINVYKKLLRLPLFFLYPILMGLAATAEPLIEIMIGSKWLPCVPILQILCFGYMFTPLTSTNLNLLYVKGRTDLVLKLEFIKKPIGFLLLFSTLQYGIYALVIGKSLYEIIAFSFNCYYTGKLLNYGEIKQLKVLFPIFFKSILMGIFVFVIIMFLDSPWIKLIVGISSGIIFYIGLAIITKDENLDDIKEIIKSRIGNREKC